MGFTAQPVDGSSPTPIPMPSAVPDGTNTPFVTEGGPAKATGGNTLAPVAVYQYDGYNETTGLKADAAYTDGTGAASGTGMGLFKGIFVKLAAIATAIVGTLKVKGDFTEIAGQGTGVVNAANTDFLPITDISAYKWFSVTIAGTWSATLTFQVSNDATFTTSQTLVVQKSDAQIANFLSVSANGTYGQTLGWRYMRVRATAFTSNTSLAGTFEFFTTPPSPLVMGVTQLGTWTVQPGNTANTTPWLVNAQRNTVAVYSLASTVTTGSTQNSGDLAVGPYAELSIDINTTAQAGTSPTIQYFYERKAADGIYYVLWQSAVLTLAANTLSTSIGAGMAYNQSLGATGRLRWVVGGSATPTFTHTLNIQGK